MIGEMAMATAKEVVAAEVAESATVSLKITVSELNAIVKSENSIEHIHETESVSTFLNEAISPLEDGETNPTSDVIDEDRLREIDRTREEYINDVREKSEFPDTIPESPFEATEIKKLTPEENAKMREEFYDLKSSLKSEWKKLNNRPWPKYEQDVYSSNGKLLRKAGDDYDIHHIHPLGMGGKNEVSNITPMHAEVHFDKQGVHSVESPYNKLDTLIGG